MSLKSKCYESDFENQVYTNQWYYYKSNSDIVHSYSILDLNHNGLKMDKKIVVVH